MSDYSFGTVNRRLPGQDDDDELQPAVGVLQVSEHGLHAVGSLSIFAETRLALYWHPGVLRDLPQLVSKGSGNHRFEFSIHTPNFIFDRQCYIVF